MLVSSNFSQCFQKASILQSSKSGLCCKTPFCKSMAHITVNILIIIYFTLYHTIPSFNDILKTLLEKEKIHFLLFP